MKIYPCFKGAFINDVMQLGVDTFFTQFMKPQVKTSFSLTVGGVLEINLGGIIFAQPLRDLPFFDSLCHSKMIVILRPCAKCYKSYSLPLTCMTPFFNDDSLFETTRI